MQFVAMDPWKRDALLRHEDYLTANLKLDSLLFRLDNGGFMTVEEKTSVEAEEGQNKQVIKMVAILRQKGNEEFVTFLNLLKETGNVLVASKLEKSAQQYKLEYPRHGKLSCFYCLLAMLCISHTIHIHNCLVFIINLYTCISSHRPIRADSYKSW